MPAVGGMPPLLARLAELAEGGRATARRCAAEALADPERTARTTLREFAARAGLSEPGVLRFVRRLGCAGFVEFKLALAQEYAVGRMYLGGAPERLTQDATGTLHLVQRGAMEAMSLAREGVSEDAMGQAAEVLRRSRRVLCFGVGGSSAVMAEEAENRLFRLDLAAMACADPYKQRMLTAIAGPGDTLLVFSITGRPRSLLDSAAIARERGVPVVGITRPNSPLAALCTTLLPLDVPEDPVHYNLPDRARYGQLLLLDCLASLIASRLGRGAARKLHSLRANLSALHGVTEGQPNGD